VLLAIQANLQIPLHYRICFRCNSMEMCFRFLDVRYGNTEG
jgi:hypothetical protein